MSLRIAALGLLTQHPGSGYDLLRRFEKSMANVWPATQSQLYGELNKMAAAGLIEVSDVGPRGRKEYRVTDAGRAELLDWVSHPQDDPPFRSAELLRVFLLGEIPAEAARDRMIAVAEYHDAEVRRLEALRDQLLRDEGGADFYGGAVLEYGLRRNATDAEWARWLAATIEERNTH